MLVVWFQWYDLAEDLTEMFFRVDGFRSKGVWNVQIYRLEEYFLLRCAPLSIEHVIDDTQCNVCPSSYHECFEVGQRIIIVFPNEFQCCWKFTRFNFDVRH